jgi:magnesium-transporting ATPase (P-type)
MARLLFCIGAFTNVVWHVYIITRLWSCECLLFVVLISCPRASSECSIFFCFIISHFPLPVTNIEPVFLMWAYWELGGEHIENLVRNTLKTWCEHIKNLMENTLRTWCEHIENLLGTFKTSKSQKVQTPHLSPQSTKELSLLGACCICITSLAQ